MIKTVFILFFTSAIAGGFTLPLKPTNGISRCDINKDKCTMKCYDMDGLMISAAACAPNGNNTWSCTGCKENASGEWVCSTLHPFPNDGCPIG